MGRFAASPHPPFAGAAAMDAAEFAARRHELFDGGRWTELVAGEPVSLAPPEPLHGTFIANLSRELADATAKNAAAGRFGAGAVFETGEQTAEAPDTVRFPAAAVFAAGVFAQIDNTVVDAVPGVVVEVPGTADRRRGVGRRVEEYHAAGVAAVWVADIADRTVQIVRPHAAPEVLADGDRLTCDPLPDFAPTVEELFKLPEWWTNQVRARS